MLVADSTWPDIERLRGQIAGARSPTLVAAAEQFVNMFFVDFASVVLARMFLVVPFQKLPATERACAETFVSQDPRLVPRTPVLSLLATRGREPAWNERERSENHRAIPLLSSAVVQGAPMIAKLLADLEIDLRMLDDGRPIATRPMLGGRNGTFFVPDAQTARDELGRPIIPAQNFVDKHAIRTVFGMGGAYVHGEIVLAILFTTEHIDRLVVDRFPSLISNFKMATAQLVAENRIYTPAQ